MVSVYTVYVCMYICLKYNNNKTHCRVHHYSVLSLLALQSFRPAAMLVERSKDFGQSWKVFRFFAEDCSLNFPSVSNQPANSVDDVICDSRYSGSQPSTDGEVTLSTQLYLHTHTLKNTLTRRDMNS